MPDRVEVFDTTLSAEENPVLMFQIDVTEAMRREPDRFVFDEAEYKKKHKPKSAAQEKKDKAEAAEKADSVTHFDKPHTSAEVTDRKLEGRRLRDRIEQLTGTRPANFVSVDELRTTLSQIEGKPLAVENKGP